MLNRPSFNINYTHTTITHTVHEVTKLTVKEDQRKEMKGEAEIV